LAERFEQSLIMHLSGTFLATPFMHRTVRLLTGSIAILDHLASDARFEAIATLTASGAL
jgi:hypothetical protein